MTTTSVKLRKSTQSGSNELVYLTSIVIPKEITESEIHQKIEEYQLTLKFSKDPRITKPGAAYELIKIGLRSLGLLET
jgi:hypothetical protein